LGFRFDSTHLSLLLARLGVGLQTTLIFQLSAKQPYSGILMRRIVFLVVAASALAMTSRLLAGDTQDSGEEFTKMKSEYADVLALQGTAKSEILTIAKILRAKPGVAVDQTAASGEYCFNSGLGTMVHFATQPEGTVEDVVYEFDASGLIAAGLDPSRLQQLPERGQMKPGVWYFLSKGQQDPHHAHAMANPTIAIAINIK
jgi:hypothetical protein